MLGASKGYLDLCRQQQTHVNFIIHKQGKFPLRIVREMNHKLCDMPFKTVSVLHVKFNMKDNQSKISHQNNSTLQCNVLI